MLLYVEPRRPATLDAGATDPCVDLWVCDRQAGVRPWPLEAVVHLPPAALVAELDFFFIFVLHIGKKMCSLT